MRWRVFSLVVVVLVTFLSVPIAGPTMVHADDGAACATSVPMPPRYVEGAGPLIGTWEGTYDQNFNNAPARITVEKVTGTKAQILFMSFEPTSRSGNWFRTSDALVLSGGSSLEFKSGSGAKYTLALTSDGQSAGTRQQKEGAPVAKVSLSKCTPSMTISWTDAPNHADAPPCTVAAAHSDSVVFTSPADGFPADLASYIGSWQGKWMVGPQPTNLSSIVDIMGIDSGSAQVLYTWVTDKLDAGGSVEMTVPAVSGQPLTLQMNSTRKFQFLIGPDGNTLAGTLTDSGVSSTVALVPCSRN